jgi:hypothetical protein
MTDDETREMGCPRLAAVDLPTLAETAPKLAALRAAARLASDRIMIGGLTSEFTNDELRLLADNYLNIGEVLTLRRLGLLAEGEGFDGTKNANPRGGSDD